MIGFLVKHFIKNPDDIKNIAVRNCYGYICSIVGIILNILLFSGKLLIGTITKSVAITADAFNNLSDAGSSIVTLLGFKLAGKKPDKKHPFGHGRIEYLSGLAISIAILCMGYEIGKLSIKNVISPVETDFNSVSIIILAVSLLIKLYIALYNRKIGNKINSKAMLATSADSLNDMISTFVVLVSILIYKLTGINIDGFAGIFVAVFILYSGFEAAKETLDPLLGLPPSKELLDSIEKIVMSHPPVCGLHDLIVHDYGPGRLIISLHAEVPSTGNIMELHDVIDNIETHISEELNCETVIHMDPIDIQNKELTNLKRQIQEFAKAISPSLTVHDFRMVPGKTHTNIIFDTVIPYDVKISEEEIVQKLSENLLEINSSYRCVIKIDKSYT